MSTVILLEATPKTAAGDATVAVRWAGGGAYPYVGYGGANDWRGGLAGLPRFSTEIGFDQTGWTGGAIPQTAVVSFKSSDQAYNSALAGLFWKGARVVVRSGDDTFGPATVFTVEMTGTVADVAFQEGGLQLTISDLSGDLGIVAAPDTFAGTGGAEGADDAAGRVKRRSWGRVFNVEGRLIDAANNVYEFGDPARPLQQFDMLKDKGRSGPMTVLAYQGSVAATLAALKTATTPSGGGVVAPSIAMAKWWTVPSGPLTADLRGETLNGYAEDAAAMAARIVAASGITSVTFGAGVTRPYVCGLHVDDASETVANVLDRLLLPVSLVWLLSPAGVITIREFTWTGAIETLASQQVSRLSTYAPLLTRKLGFQRNNRIQSDSEIASTLLLATDATYADGTPIEVLKPAQAGADVTSGHTAAAITGQGAFATVSQAAYGSSLLTGFGQLSPLNNIAFGSNYLLEATGGALATLNAFKTALGIASGFTGQGSLATQSSAAYGSQISGLPFGIQPSNLFTDGNGFQYVQATSIAWSKTDGASVESVRPAERGSNVTETRVAAAFVGQNSLATKDRVNLGTAGGMADEANSYWLTSGVVVTSQGVSSAIAGQGTFATKSSAIMGNSNNPGDLRDVNGGTVLDSAIYTAFGTAASIAGQGKFATAPTIAGSNVSTYFNFSAFQLNYSITRSDGTTTVTENLVVTQIGIAAGFTGQGGLAVKNQAGYPELNVADLTAQTNDALNGVFGGTFTPAISYVPNFGKDMAIKGGGTIYVSFSGGSVVTNGAVTNVYNSVEILNAADNSVLASVRLPNGAPGTSRLDNYIIMIPNQWGTLTIRWRIATRGQNTDPAAASQVSNLAVTVQWKAL